MSLDISIAGATIPTDSATLQDLRADLNLAFQLGSGLKPYLNSALSSIPDLGKITVNYTSSQAVWEPADSLVTFGLQGGASGSLDVVNNGTLVTYTDGLECSTQKNVTVPAGHAYVRLTLNFTMSASASAQYSGGAYGVTASGCGGATYAITFCKAFAPTVKLIDAIGKTFASFMLPFTARTLQVMSDGDYLWHEFDGNFAFAVGAYAGVEKVLYAGQGSADVLQAFGSPLATLSNSVNPAVNLAASMDFKMTYATSFEALLSRASNAGSMHLFKSSKTTTGTTIGAGLSISMNGSVGVEQAVNAHLDDLKTSLVNAAGGADSPGGKALGAVVNAAESQAGLDKYVAEATDKLQGWLNRANGLQANLQVAIESSRSRTLLAGYIFDLQATDFTKAWDCATRGDLLQVLQTNAVTLDIGSGIEKEYQSKTSFQCNFFNLWHMSTWNQFAENVSMVYAGNNVFHMVANVGRSTETDYVGAMHSMDMCFTASADTDLHGAASDVEVTLNLAMNAQGDSKAIEAIALLVNGIDGSPAITNLVTALRAFNTNTKTGSVQVLVKISPSGFRKIVCDAKAGPHDQANWNTFAQAADDLGAWPLRYLSAVNPQTLQRLKQYSAWKELNTVESGATAPDRNQWGSTGAWPDDWNAIDPSVRPQIWASMRAGQHFMNLCDALQKLASVQTVDGVKTPWETLLALITSAMKNDVSVDFLRPTALATIRLCKGNTYVLTGPAGPCIPMNHFAVSLVL